jgi:acetylornithine deacetylase/succinyl-diaminopimelate desuccinylase family protein
MTLLIDRDYVTRTLADLVCINSINPALEPGGPGERAIAAYVADALTALGCKVATHEPEPERVSVVGRWGGARGRSLMLNAHMDTVGVAGMAEPFSGAVRDGKLYGRGAYDMKGSLAACLGAVKALADAKAKLAGTVLVAAVADEEHASLGTADLLRHYQPDAAIVTEPTALEICLAHKGFAWIDVTTAGRAAHGSRPDLGVDANMAMGRVLAALAPLERELRARAPHALVGTASLHVGVLAGGAAPSVYSSGAKATIERRTVPGETDAQVVGEIEAILTRLAREDPPVAARATLGLSRPPFEVARDAEVVQALARAYQTALGRGPTFGGQTPWMESALLAEAGVETVVFGPGGAGAHAAEEWVDLESVFAVAAVLAQAAVAYCGR